MTVFFDYILDELRLKDVPDGSGGFWGSFYDATTQTAASTTAAYPITLNTTSGSNGVAIGSPTSKVVFTYAGVYSITFSIQFENSSADDHRITTWLKKNGTDITDSSSITSIPKSHGADNGAIITTVNYVIELQAGDYLQTYWQTESTAVSITTIPAGTTPTTPLSPSIIFTAVQGGIITQGSTANSLASLTDVSFTSLASGQIIMSNASGNWSNVNFPAIPSIPSLGSLAVMNQLSFTSLTNQPSLGSLAVLNSLSYTSLSNLPSLGSLAILNDLSYTSLLNLPSLGSLAVMNQLSFTSLLNQPSLGSLAFQNYVNYSQISNTPSLGSLAIMNQLSFTSLVNQPSLGSLAPLNSITQAYLPSSASFSILTTQGIVNASTVSTNRLNSNQLIVTSTASINNLNLAGTLTGSGNINITSTIFGSNLTGTNTGDQILPVYGDGADGSVDFNSSNLNSNFSTFDGSFTYTLTRDVFATYINVNASVIVITAGYRLFAQNEISNAGTIHNNGAAASGTTAGAGGLGGFFKAGGTGATGLLAASAGANGTAQATPTANTWVGGLGGKGGQGRATNTTFNGGMITSANVTPPANADGGSKVTSNFINYLTRYIVGATNWQMTPSIGGGSGAKSATGTTATSGGGGGGGGVCFVAAPVITGVGTISANGGAGGNAAGTGGSFGGGGGGGGGVMCMIAKTSDITPTATGGNGGTSVFGTNGTLPVASANGTTTSTTTTMTLSPTTALSKGKLYMITFHLNITGGIGGSGINSVEGYGMVWQLVSGSRVEFNTIASPTRAMETWYGFYFGGEPDLVQSDTITVTLSNANTAARVIIDEITNVDLDYFNPPVTTNIATNVTNSATTLTVTLPTAPTTGNLVYSVFSRSGGTAPVAGAGNTLVNSQTVAPQITSQVSSAQTANIQTHTTAAAVAGFSVEITASASGINGDTGWEGKVVRIYG